MSVSPVLLCFRCNVVINFFENAHKIVISEECCYECNSQLLKVTFNKVSHFLN